MNRLPHLLVAVCALLPEAHAQLVQEWQALRSSHFDLVSRYDSGKAGPLLEELEWLRDVFDLNFSMKSGLKRPVMLFVADSPHDYDQISPSKLSHGYYLGAPWRDIIVLRDLQQARHALFHEYTHLVLRHRGGRLLAWFNEGTAEFYGSTRRAKNGAEAGVPDPARVNYLRTHVWIPVAYVTSLETSLALDSADAMQRFYSQSWAYVHMLHLSATYSPRVKEFAALLGDGASTGDALRKVYDKTLIQFDDDARKWVRRDVLPAETLRAPPSSPAKIDKRALAEIDVDMLRTTIAISGPARADGNREYARLARAGGSKCEFQAALGDVAHSARRMREAAFHYQEAIRCGASAEELAQGIAETFAQRNDVTREELATVAKVSDDGRTRFLVGTGLYFSGDMEGALRELERAKGLPQPDEFRAMRITAMALARLKRHAEAEAMAQKLQALAHDEDQRRSAAMTQDDLQRARGPEEPSPADRRKALLDSLTRTEGEVVRIDCLGEQARIWFRAAGLVTKLLIASPGEVITGPDGAPSLELSCGTQQRRAVVGYQAETDKKTETIGRVRYLEFR